VYYQTAGLDERMKYAEDRDLVYKLEEVATPVFVDAVLYRYRETSDSQSRNSIKHEIGAVNTRAARRAALDRRGVRGLVRVVWDVVFLVDYALYSRRTHGIPRMVLKILMPALCRLVDPGRSSVDPVRVARRDTVV
jgi:hypothetical protein